jgi:hypothetical protein
MAEIQFVLRTVTYNVGNYLNMNTQSSSVRRMIYPIQWYTVLLVSTEIHESKHIFTVIGLVHGPWMRCYLSPWKSWPHLLGNIYSFSWELEFYQRSRGVDRSTKCLFLKQSVIPLAHSRGYYGKRESRNLHSASGGLIWVKELGGDKIVWCGPKLTMHEKRHPWARQITPAIPH